MMLENFIFVFLFLNHQAFSIKTQIVIDKTKNEEFRCNDHQDRIRLKINFLNSTNYKEKDKFQDS